MGNELYPIVVSNSAPACRAFDFSQYSDEIAGSLDLLKHHQVELAKFGVKFGRDAFSMYDLYEHEDRNMYPIIHHGQEYHGGLDGGIAPSGLSISSAAAGLRIAYMHKQSHAQKQRHREQHSHMAQVLSHVLHKLDCTCCAVWVSYNIICLTLPVACVHCMYVQG